MFTDIKKLRAFVAIVEEQSITMAADRLNVAQPWVSVQLKQLEEMLGAVLIERTKGKFIKLTSEGRKLLPVARRLLDACEEAGREIDRIRGKSREQLVLGVDPATLYMDERNQLVRQFLNQRPETELRIVSATPAELFEGLRDRELDLVLTLCPAGDDDFEIMALYEYELCCLIPNSNSQLRADFETKELHGATVMVLPDSYHPAFFQWMKQSLSAYGITWKDCPEISYQALIHYSAMLGIATLSPDFSLNLPEISSEMEVRPVTQHPVTVQWALMRLAGSKSAEQDLFWEMAAKSRFVPH